MEESSRGDEPEELAGGAERDSGEDGLQWVESGSVVHDADVAALEEPTTWAEQTSWEALVLAWARRLEPSSMVFIPPNLPDQAADEALLTYLRLEPGEVLLALIDPSRGKGLSGTLALTNERLVWCRKPGLGRSMTRTRWIVGPMSGSVEERVAEHTRMARYRDLARGRDEVRAIGLWGRRIDFGIRNGPPIRLPTKLAVGLADALNGLAETLRTGEPAGGITEEAVRRAERDLPRLMGGVRTLEQAHAELQRFRERVRRGSEPVLTGVILAICVAVFLVMSAQGVFEEPVSALKLGDWGANFGPYTVLDGEWWRLITVQFLHGGFWHLFFNMWCLCRVGPLQERIYGHLGFLLLYLGSGVGGALLSLMVHPARFSVGASGAIFGLFGSLLAFLALQPKSMPRMLLRPLRSSAVAFVLVNLVLGFGDKTVDWAGHVGGLLTGFACGLLIQRHWPEPGGAGERPRRLLGGMATLALLGAGAFVVGVSVSSSPITTMLTHEGQADAKTHDAIVVPAARDVQAIAERMDRLIKDAQADQVSEEEYIEQLDELIARGDEVVMRMRGVSIGHEQMGSYLKWVRALAEHERDALQALRRYADTGDESDIDGPGGYVEKIDAYGRLMEQIEDPENPVRRWMEELKRMRSSRRRDQ